VIGQEIFSAIPEQFYIQVCTSGANSERNAPSAQAAPHAVFYFYFNSK